MLKEVNDLSFEKQHDIAPPVEPLRACSCGSTYDPAKSQDRYTNDQLINAGTCSPAS
jgi:hypothetical protein